MTSQRQIENCKTVFALDMADKFANVTGIVFAATRPLLGADLNLGVCLNGRHHVTVDMEAYGAEAFIQKNIELDARVVVPASKAELVEVVLQGNKYAARYREYPLDEQFDLLSHKINALRDMPYGEAVSRIKLARETLAA